jgi:glycogen debranching enzyme
MYEVESSNAITFADKKSNSKRPDIELKYSIRALRKYFRDQFRTHHAKLINKRIVNCTPKEVYNAVSDLLTNVLEFYNCDKDTIFYLIGILDLKQVNWMACTKIIKNEVKEFLD